MAPHHEERARHHHDHLHEPHAEIVEREGAGHDAVGLQLGLLVGAVVGGEELALVVLVGEGLHRADAADVLFQPSIEGADAGELRSPITLHRPALAHADADHAGQNKHGDEGERPMHRQHQREGAEQRHQGDEQVLRPMVGDLADLLQVLGDAGDQMARLLPVVETERQLLQVVEGAPTHLRLDVDAEHVTPVGDDHHQPSRRSVDNYQAGGGAQDETPVVAGQQHVDEGLHRHREAEFEQP